jgi:hypothetical protein
VLSELRNADLCAVRNFFDFCNIFQFFYFDERPDSTAAAHFYFRRPPLRLPYMLHFNSKITPERYAKNIFTAAAFF